MDQSKKSRVFLIVLLAISLIAPAIPQVQASPGGMEQVLFSGYWDTLNPTTTEYNSLVGAISWSDNEFRHNKVVSTDGIIKNLQIQLSAFPASRYTFTLMLNGAPTALSVELSGMIASGNDTVNEIHVTGGDTVSLRCVPYETPIARRAYWTCVFEGDISKESIILGGSHSALSNIDIEYGQVMTAYTIHTTTEDDYRQIVPTAGIVKNFYVKLDTDPGTAPDAYRLTLRKGGVSQTLTVTITADDTTGSDLVNSFAVVAGDVLTMMIEPLNTPSATPIVQWGMTFVAEIDGESIVLGGSSNRPYNDISMYNYLISYSGSIWSSVEDQRYSYGQTCTLKKLYVLLEDAPGTGNSYELRIRMSGADTDLGVYIAGLETTGHSSVNDKVDITNSEYIGLKCIPTSNPAETRIYWGLVCYTGPPLPEPKYTENLATFTITADGIWTDYDIFTNQGVPKGRVAEIVCANKNTDFARLAGVRTDGSSLNRYIDLHEAEGLGVTTSSMFVKVDGTTGLVECYSEIQGDVDFYLLGYFGVDVDFTEAFTILGQPSINWADKDLTDSGVPDDAVVQILMGNDADTADYFAGVRADISGLERGVTLDEAEADGWSTLSMVVQSNADAVIEWKAVVSGRGGSEDVTMWLLGWFSSGVSFTENWVEYSPAVDSTWESVTVSDADVNSIIVFALLHQDSGSETFCGLREEGSVSARMIEEHEAEGGASSGFEACILLDGDKKCEVYCEDASEAQFYYTGYFTIEPLKPNIPSLVLIHFNTTIAGDLCGIYAEFFDTEGLFGYIFWNNATSPPGGVNSSFTSMTGTSNSTQETVTLPSSGTLFGARYYVNDTDGYWGRASLITFPTARADGAPPVDDYSVIFLAIGLILMLCVAFLYVKRN